MHIFYRRGTMESWGRGISHIMQSCRDQGLPEPRIEIVSNFVNLTIWFNELLSAQDATSVYKTPQNVGDMSAAELSERQREIVAIIKSSPTITGKKMSETLSMCYILLMEILSSPCIQLYDRSIPVQFAVNRT